jgi:hypothetical protein
LFGSIGALDSSAAAGWVEATAEPCVLPARVVPISTFVRSPVDDSNSR